MRACVAADHGEGEEEEEVSRHDVIVTASSHNHRHALASFLEYFTRCGLGVRLVVYDLGGGSVGSGGRWNSSASRQATRRGGTIGRTRPR